ncbi:glycosyltransferase involved in cell wall biosynthesis [Chitinophaga niastensis]|uniref:Glycosyltransferase involved in cell wall biosynthesis n=1 Tax=Chitinophaga niastensis TaxID=536980 RepID=A0A2P8HQ15_CHINA|nr:glycosyltransferase [Chitinophaga niastensis]PSL48330.1 glycosyltransferase involved in cell wall biosynthesis [Chitinophaga niastensis]
MDDQYTTSQEKRSGKGVSVIICCYNSAARLPQTLWHLAEQLVPEDFSWEILLVNNASKDNTVASAIEIWHSFSPSNATFRVIEEPIPGQMYARKTGAIAAKYECLVFCDDDNWLGKNYVYLAWEMMAHDSNIGAGGGQNAPATDAPEYPDWFEEYKDKYALGIPAQTSGDVSHRGFVLGAGLVTRRLLFLSINDEKYPSLLNGRNGEKLSTGDDFEYCKRLLLWGYKLHYQADMYLTHFIPKERLTIHHREKLMEGIMDSRKVLGEYDLAVKLNNRNKHKNRWRLLFLAPFRIIAIKLGISSREVINEAMTFFYLSPFSSKSDYTRLMIKKFLYRQS